MSDPSPSTLRRARVAAGTNARTGAPTLLDAPERVSLRLDGDLAAIAQRAGSGNVSAGIRAALRAWGEAHPG